MKSPIDGMLEQPTGDRYSDRWPRPIARFKESEPIPTLEPFRMEYTLQLRLGTTFVCNQAQYRQAREHAEELLIHKLYGDMLGMIAEATHAVYSDGPEATLEVLNKMRKYLTRRG